MRARLLNSDKASDRLFVNYKFVHRSVQSVFRKNGSLIVRKIYRDDIISCVERVKVWTSKWADCVLFRRKCISNDNKKQCVYVYTLLLCYYYPFAFLYCCMIRRMSTLLFLFENDKSCYARQYNTSSLFAYVRGIKQMYNTAIKY